MFFFFNDTATTEIYTLSLHDALPISRAIVAATERPSAGEPVRSTRAARSGASRPTAWRSASDAMRSEEHTSELQSRLHLVCRLLLEKKKKIDDIRSQ